MKKSILIALVFIAITASAQQIKIIASHDNISFRGMSIVQNCIWVSGNNGTVGRSVDGGNTFQWSTVKGFEKTDFRDIEAFDDTTAIIMGIASPAYILKTTDGGISWKKVYENNEPDIFLDAMAFKNKKEGFAIGDPIKKKFFVVKTSDGGNSWLQTDELNLPDAVNGEAFFAASGTNIVFSADNYYVVSGGFASRFFANSTSTKLPITQGLEMTGANGLAIQNKNILVPGGNYNSLNKMDSAFTYSADNGYTWKLPVTMPSGYRSCVCFAGKNIAIACGITGVDISMDNGKNWKNISKEGFNVCIYSKREKAVYFAGNKGRLGKLMLKK